MYHTLFQQLTPQCSVLTVNRRLSNLLNEQHCLHQQQQGLQTWQAADILPFNTWLERCWQAVQLHHPTQQRQLIFPHQEKIIWTDIIKHSSHGEKLLRVNATAEIALQAWQLVKQWRVDFHDSAFALNEDTEAWQQWALSYETYCEENHLQDSATLAEAVTELITRSSTFISKHIYLAGFDELTPQQRHLLDILKTHGCEIEIYKPHGFDAEIQRVALSDPQTELTTLARWAKQEWQRDPQQTIACVIPHLAEIRQQVINTFNEVFDPVSLLPGQSTSALPYNISAAPKLIQYPLIYMALEVLQIGKQIDCDNLGMLLRTPFIAYAEQEMGARALLDATLRKQGETKISLQQLIISAKKYRCPLLAGFLQTYGKARQELSTHQLPSAWAEYFAKILLICGWPGERPLDSTEFQLIDTWQEIFNKFSQLDLVTGKITEAIALQTLREIVINTQFQPEKTDTPIQISGVLETAGLFFDKIWVMNLHDNSWPLPAIANPFIPLTLQKQHGLPHASSERELLYCRMQTDRLTHAAKHVIFSHPEYIDDHLARASALIINIPLLPTHELNLSSYTPFAELIWQTQQIEYFSDQQAPAVLADEKISGGSAIFKYQAACPFSAFATFRLHAKALEQPQAGLTAQQRGTLLHAALEIVWNMLGSSEHLHAHSEDELTVIIQQAIDTALVNFIKDRPYTFRQRFTELEKVRLQHLLSDWLALEKKRPPFKVLAMEKSSEHIVAGIPVKLRIDRIDELLDGKFVIIDYKTGKANLSDWSGTRPNEPQLPLYCVVSELAVSGILFAQVRAEQIKFLGTADSDLNIGGVKPIQELSKIELPSDWQALIPHWQDILTQLGQQFLQGHAAIDPKYHQQTCSRCDLGLLCRMHEFVSN